jgi:hypothetical protein
VLDDLRLMNDATIIYLNKNSISNNRNYIIKKILEDDACFFKLEKDDAYIILDDIGVKKDEIPNVYSLIISYDEFKKLKNTGKIDDDDKELKFNFKEYNPEDIFKDRNKQIDTKKEVIENTNKIIKYNETIFKKIVNWMKNIFNK